MRNILIRVPTPVLALSTRVCLHPRQTRQSMFLHHESCILVRQNQSVCVLTDVFGFRQGPAWEFCSLAFMGVYGRSDLFDSVGCSCVPQAHFSRSVDLSHAAHRDCRAESDLLDS